MTETLTPSPDVTAWMVVFRAAHPIATRAQAFRAYVCAHSPDRTVHALHDLTGVGIGELLRAYDAAAA